MDGLAQDTDLIRRLVKFAGTTPAAVAKRAGVAVTTINRPFTGTSPSRLGRAVLEKLQAAYPDFPGWAAGEVSDRLLPFRHAAAEPDADLVQIDSIDLSYGLGGTFVNVAPVDVEKVSFSRSWLRQFTHSAPHHLSSTQGIGDSMQPTIHDRDVVIFDRSRTRLDDELTDRIWVCAFGEIGMIKRLRQLPDGSVRIMSDNQSVRDEIAADGDLHLIGRVVAVVRRH